VDLPLLFHYRVYWFHVHRVHARQCDGVLDFGSFIDPIGFGGGRFTADEVSYKLRLHHFRRLSEIDAVEFSFHIRDLVFTIGAIAAAFHC